MPLPRALMRRTISIQVDETERLWLQKVARDTGMSVANYLRTGRGLPERSAGRPTVEELERESDWAWNKLKELELNPEEYFPPDDDWMEEYR
jgi:hypothetical protein